VGFRQTRALRFDVLQVGLSDHQAGQVHTTQVAAQQPQQVDDVAWAVTLLLHLSPAQPAQQARQPLLRHPGAAGRVEPGVGPG
jgi:hypothetical protein